MAARGRLALLPRWRPPGPVRLSARAAGVVLAMATAVATAGYARQDRPQQADGIVQLLYELERAIERGEEAALREIASPDLPAPAVNWFAVVTRGGAGASATIRERLRRANGAAYEIVADVLMSRDPRGRVATWQLVAEPDPLAAGRYRLADLRELAAVDGLLKLQLDARRQFAIKDLIINAPDLALRMSSGSAFVVESPAGVTGLVLHGRGEVLFSPSDPAEQRQVQIFSRRSPFRTDVRSVFLRVNPAEFAERASTGSLTPTRVDAADLARAQRTFTDMSPRSYNVDVRALSTDRWSIEPPPGSLVVEFETGRHGWLTYTRSPGEDEDISLFHRATNRNVSLYASAARAAADRDRSFSDADRAAYALDHYQVDAAFDPARLVVSGRARMRLRVGERPQAVVAVRLAPQLVVTSVSSPELGDLIALRVVGQSQLLIGLPGFIDAGRPLTIDVTYAGRLAPQTIDREAMTVQSADPQDTPDRLIVTPLPRFMYSNQSLWYPRTPHAGYATADLRLSVPSEYQIVASGTLVRTSIAPAGETGQAGGRSLRTVEYRTDRPVRYLACLISRFVPVGSATATAPVAPAPSDQVATTITAINVEVVATARVAARNRQTPERTAAILTYFAGLVGEAPYPGLTIAALDDNLPGGHSPAYFAALHQALPTTPYNWSGDPVAFDNEHAPFFLAHEIAHQWWGQAVGWRNYREQWLSEGLAQYFAALYAGEDRGPAMLDSLIAQMRSSSESLLGQGPISLGYRLGHLQNDSRLFRAIVYNKSAVVLHMLRRLIGDDAFFAGLRQYYTDQRFKAAGTEHLQAAMEAHTPIPLGRFFDGWVRGFGRPRVRLGWATEDAERTGVITAEQTGALHTFPLTVAVQFADGRTEIRTLRIVDGTFEERFEISSAIRRVTARDPLTYFETVR